MKATETNLLKFQQGTNQFIIPIYQRAYSWNLKHCRQLWDDIARASRDPATSGHFIGSVVYIEDSLYQATRVPQLLVIDGQQRLTTVSLLLAALAEFVDDPQVESDVSARRIRNYYLFNSEEEGDLRFKLMLTKNDKESFMRLVKGLEPLTASSPRLTNNYEFFQKMIREGDLSPDELFEGIGKLLVVDVALDRRYDNPQLIFESLNSTGLDLSQADLIRNYVLMGIEPHKQTDLYQNYWFPMEQSFGHIDYAKQFDRFMRDYLTVKNAGAIPKIDEVYVEFKNDVNRTNSPIHDIVENVQRYSKYWIRMAASRNEEDQELRELFAEINILRVDVAYPFLLEVYDDYSQQKLSRDDFVRILKLVQTYVFRRAICGIPTNSLNKTFATLSAEIDKSIYLESVQTIFLRMKGYRRLPNDEEFQREFMVKDIYSFRNRNFLLRKLENHGRKEVVNIGDYTIEHVMPQNPELSHEWQVELGPDWKAIQGKHLHTIGNLTLTGYNPELSDRPFGDKRDMEGGFKDSPIRLNQILAGLEMWTENEIQQRARQLTDLATQVWDVPKLADLEKYKQPTRNGSETNYTRSDLTAGLDKDTLDLFDTFSKRVLNLDSAVTEEINKQYVAYKAVTNFADVIPQKSNLKLYLNLPFDGIDDPEQLCRDVSQIGHWGNGDIEVSLSSSELLDDVLYLVLQAFDFQREDVDR